MLQPVIGELHKMKGVNMADGINEMENCRVHNTAVSSSPVMTTSLKPRRICSTHNVSQPADTPTHTTHAFYLWLMHARLAFCHVWWYQMQKWSRKYVGNEKNMKHKAWPSLLTNQVKWSRHQVWQEIWHQTDRNVTLCLLEVIRQWLLTHYNFIRW